MKLSNGTLVASAALCLLVRTINAYPKLLIAGSTTVASTGDNIATGWAPYIAPYLNISVLNLAVPRSSVRQTYGSPQWLRAVNLVSPGDYVIIEYGQEDEGDPLAKDNATRTLRPTLPGTGEEIVTVTLEQRTADKTLNSTETVHTFGWYLKNMIIDVRAKNGNPILSSLIPKNWASAPADLAPLPGTAVFNGTKSTLQTAYPFRDYAEAVAQELKTEFVDHTTYTLKALQDLGPADAVKLYVKGTNSTKAGLYTNSKGGRAFAKTFVQALRCSESDLADYLNEDGLAVELVVC
jgi:rhamnogalacturonan acetylesterase